MLTDDLAGCDLPAWAEWLAQDEDGVWWAYEAEPNQQHNGWYENEVGRIQHLVRSAAPANWRTQLVRIEPSMRAQPSEAGNRSL
jgi:hypothetical protein